MIYDIDTQVSAVAPQAGEAFTFSAASYDLIGGSDGVPALLGTGERLFMQFEVTVAFTQGALAPRALFGVAIDTVPAITQAGHVLAFTGGSMLGDEAGFELSELTLGRTFHLPIPSWEDVMEDDAAAWPHAITPPEPSAEETAFRAKRYLGILIYNPTVTAANYFGVGTVEARIVKDPGGTAVLSNIYPSRMKVT